MKPSPLFALLSCVLACGNLLQAAPPGAVIDALRSPTPEVEPVLFYPDSSDTNQGTGDSGWITATGTALSERGRDPWGNDAGAFGLPSDALSGACITNSIESPLLIRESGTVILCVYLPEVTGDPAMILSRGTWGDRSSFDLRVDKARNIILYTGGAGEKPTTLNLGSFVPWTWNFLALTWAEKDGEMALDTITGEIVDRQVADSRSFTIAQAGAPNTPVLMAGRIKADLYPALLQEGLFSCLAIYDSSLSPEILEGIFQLMCITAKP